MRLVLAIRGEHQRLRLSCIVADAFFLGRYAADPNTSSRATELRRTWCVDSVVVTGASHELMDWMNMQSTG